MARSIHTTRKSVRALVRKKRAGEAIDQKKIDAAAKDLRRKRRIKRMVRAERKGTPEAVAVMDIDTIPIEVRDEGEYVHHGASAEDVRAVLRLLTAAAVEGIAKIELSSGQRYLEEMYGEEMETRDPFVGRLSSEIMPSVYAGECLGTYTLRQGQIRIFAYAYDPQKLPLPRRFAELYLRLKSLVTLVHEVAHFHDDVQRTARGRWLADRHENLEWYAEKMEYQWSREAVIPYLEKTYTQDVNDFLKWMEAEVGIPFTLDFFAGDGRRTERNGLTRLTTSSSAVFQDWMRERSGDVTADRMVFAIELHYADRYEECLQVLEGILKTDAKHLRALVCKADTLEHLERLDESYALIEGVLAEHPEDGKAWEVRANIFSERKDWSGLLENCERWEKAVGAECDSRFWLCHFYADAYCGLSRFEQMEEWIVRWANFGGCKKRNVERIRKGVYRRVRGADFVPAKLAK